jgi:serine/threonine protein kinase
LFTAHRDINPSNVMLSKRADKIVALISGFGRAKQLPPDSASREQSPWTQHRQKTNVSMTIPLP